MKYYFACCLFCISAFSFSISHAQYKRIDTAMKIGKAGYRVQCGNKSTDKNELSVKPVGFESTAREMSFFVKGRVLRVGIEDLNNDSYPDLLIYLYSGDNGQFGTVYVFMSDANKSCIPVPLPDVMLDGKLKEGYKGHDEFSLLEGTLIQQFPLYKTGDTDDKPTGGKRVVQYHIVPEAGGFKFKVLRSYETK